MQNRTRSVGIEIISNKKIEKKKEEERRKLSSVNHKEYKQIWKRIIMVVYVFTII
jgi:hypothetical protein